MQGKESGQGCDSHRHRLQSPKDICITSFFVIFKKKYFRSIFSILFSTAHPPIYSSHTLKCFPKAAACLREIVKLRRGNIAGNITVSELGRHLSQTPMVPCCSGVSILLFFLLSLQCYFRPQSHMYLCMHLTLNTRAVTLPPVRIFT